MRLIKLTIIYLIIWPSFFLVSAKADTLEIHASDKHCGWGSFEAYPIMEVIGDLRFGAKVKLTANFDITASTSDAIRKFKLEGIMVCSVGSQGKTQHD